MNEVIQFNYLHRDSGNWKKYGCKKFSNPEQLSIEEIEQKIRQNLIDREYFIQVRAESKSLSFIVIWMIIHGMNLNRLNS